MKMKTFKGLMEIISKDVKDDLKYMDSEAFSQKHGKKKNELRGFREDANMTLDAQINEVLSKDASAGEYIHDFVHSDNPKFAGKSKEERKKQALAAYYAQKNEEVVDEGFERSSSEFLKKHKDEMEKHKQDQKAKRERMDMNLKNYQAGKVRASGIKEAKEKTEYDYEGDMARGQLQSIINNAQKVHDMLEDNDNLPEWVQSKITLSEDYISTVANYMMSELDEETEKHSFVAVHVKKGKHETYGSTSYEAAQNAAKHWKMKNTAGIDVYRSDKKHVDEETEQMNENTITHIVAKKDLQKHKSWMDSEGYDTKTKPLPKEHAKHNTHVGIISSNYVEHGYHEDGMAVPIKEEVVQIEEGRPSQQHPLEGHPYHKKTNAELEYISKDARAAGEAMKSHGTESGRAAENKYADQANDSATVRHFRKTSGMPSWYKKKYDLNESELEESSGYKQKSDVNHGNASIKAPGTGEKLSFLNKMYPNKKKQPNGAEFAAQRRVNRIADSGHMDEEKKSNDEKTPFAGPYKKTTGTVTDKSGAKHSGMSIAKDLARKALKRVSSSMVQKEQVEKSSKAKLIKKISKGKESPDKFQAEPELSKNTASGRNSYTDT